jgi:beta-lactamase regulating signal transducer with metallopeptidase domain/TolA-binding protein
MDAFLNACIAGVNTIGRGFCAHAAGMFVQSGVLIVVLLSIDLVLRSRIRATVRYWIWMLVIVKLLLPPTFSLPTGVGHWAGQYVALPAPVARQILGTPSRYEIPEEPLPPEAVDQTSAPPLQRPDAGIAAATAEPISVRGEQLTWQGGALLLWGIGVLGFALWVIRRALFVRALMARGRPAEGGPVDLLDECCRHMNIHRQVRMKLLPRAFSPAVCGLRRPTILLPQTLPARLAPENLRAVLIHELAHVKRGDLWINCVQTILQVIYFYNPLVWLANAIVRRVREQAVDEMALVALGAEARSYGDTLIDVAEMAFGRANPALGLVGVAESKKSLEGRIKRMLARPIPKSAKLGLAGCLAVIVTAAILLPMAQAQDSPPSPTADGPNSGAAVTPRESRGPITQDEDEAEALLKVADAYCQQNKYAEACGVYRHLLDKYPGAACTGSARGSLVLAAALLGDEPAVAAAIEAFLAGLPQDQRRPQQVLDVAEKLRLRFKYGPARRLLQYVIETWPETQEAASSRMCLVDAEVAPLVPAQNEAVLQETIEKLVTQYQGNPYLPRTIDRIGDLCALGKRYEEAEVVYRRVIALAGDDTERAADAQMAIAWLYFERGRYEDALREYAKIVQDYPKTRSAAGGQYWLGQCYLSKGDLDQAEREYKKTIDLYPGDIYAGHAQRQLVLVDRRREIAGANTQRREALQRTTNLRSAQVGQAQPPLAVRPASEAPAPVQPARALNLSVAEYESRVTDILQRLSMAVGKAYQQVGLAKEDVERGTLRTSSDPNKVKAYRQSWPAINDARQTAIEELAALGAGVVPVLLKSRDTSGDRRGEDLFASAIRMIGGPAVPAAIDGLTSPDRMVRMRAANSLCTIRDSRAVEPLIRALADSDRGVLVAVVGALGAFADPRAADPLLALWNKAEDVIRPQLAWALATIGDRRAVEPIMGALQERLSSAKQAGSWEADSWLMRRYAEALGQLRDARAIPLLKELLRAAPQKTKADRDISLMAEAVAGALRRFGYQVTGDQEKGYEIAEGLAREPPYRQALQQSRDYEAAQTVPQSTDRWRTQGYGGPGNPRTWQAFQRDGRRAYPVTFLWPLIQGAGKYVVHVKGLRGSRPTRSYEATTNSVRLERKDLEPGRYQWSVSVYDERGEYLADVETIDPVEVFAVADPRPVRLGAKRVLIDLNHSAGSIAGWGGDNHGQYMTKELLESIGCEVQVNSRDLLTAEKLRSTDLLICHYYWAGWPGFRPYLDSELAAVYQFVADGGSLLVVGCDRVDGGGKMTPAGNELVKGFGFLFKLDVHMAQDGWAGVLPSQSILSLDRRIQVQLPVSVEGAGSIPLLQFQGIPIAQAKEFGKGRIIVAGVGMSFLDCYLGDFEHREPVHVILFYDFIKYLAGVDWRQACDRELLQTILSRVRSSDARP